jgi:hypothetical protein
MRRRGAPGMPDRHTGAQAGVSRTGGSAPEGRRSSRLECPSSFATRQPVPSSSDGFAPVPCPRSSRPKLGIAFGVLLLPGSLGCSFVFTRGPPASTSYSASAAEPAQCTESNAAPIADTVLAVSMVALATAAIVYAAQPCPHPPQVVDSMCGWNELAYFPAGATALLGGLFTASAVVGYSRTGACRESRGLATVSGGSSFGSALAAPSRGSEGCPPTGDAPRVCALDPGFSAWRSGPADGR